LDNVPRSTNVPPLTCTSTILPRLPSDQRSAFRRRRRHPANYLARSRSQAPQTALHRADEVENVVLVACVDQLAKQPIVLTRLSPHPLGLGRVVPVLPVGPARPLQSLWRARSGASSTVHAASPVRHRSTSTPLTIPAPRATSRVTGRVAPAAGRAGRAAAMAAPASIVRPKYPDRAQDLREAIRAVSEGVGRVVENVGAGVADAAGPTRSRRGRK
jgi:hypothetical protein